MKKRILIVYATYGSGHKAIAKYINNYFLNKRIKERKCVCQCCLPMHLGILNSGAVAWMGTAQVCLPYMFYVGFFFCIVIVFSLAD